MGLRAISWWVVLCLLWLSACKPVIELPADDPVMATVHDKVLHWSDVAHLVPTQLEPADSLRRLNAIITHWIKKSLMEIEAEKNIPSDLNINQLVNDYRQSLIVHHYEKKMVESRMDSLVSEAEMLAYYDQNKGQFPLKYTIVKAYFLKFPTKDRKKVAEIKKQLVSAPHNVDLLNLITGTEGEILLHGNQWHRALDVMDKIPGKVNLNQLREGNILEEKEQKFIYLLKTLQRVDAEEYAPLSYVEEQIKKIILQQRKFKLLDQLSNELYEAGIKQNQVKIYTNEN